MVNALPVAAPTFRLFTLAAKTIGAVMVWLPPLLLIVAVPVVFAKVNVLEPAGTIVKLAARLLKPIAARLSLLSKVTVPPFVPDVPKTAVSPECPPGNWLPIQLPAVVHDPLPVCQTPATTLGGAVIVMSSTLPEMVKLAVSLENEPGKLTVEKALIGAAGQGDAADQRIGRSQGQAAAVGDVQRRAAGGNALALADVDEAIAAGGAAERVVQNAAGLERQGGGVERSRAGG